MKFELLKVVLLCFMFMVSVMFVSPTQAQCFEVDSSYSCVESFDTLTANPVIVSQPVIVCQDAQFLDRINFGCVSTAIREVRACREAGGPFFGCLADGFATYLDCNGGLAKQRRDRRRAARKARRTRRSSFSGC